MKHDKYRTNYFPDSTRTSVPTNDDLVAALVFVVFVTLLVLL